MILYYMRWLFKMVQHCDWKSQCSQYILMFDLSVDVLFTSAALSTEHKLIFITFICIPWCLHLFMILDVTGLCCHIVTLVTSMQETLMPGKHIYTSFIWPQMSYENMSFKFLSGRGGVCSQISDPCKSYLWWQMQ